MSGLEMTPERLQAIEEIFHSALDSAPASRSAFLDRACHGDDPLRHEVEALLASHASAEEFIEGLPTALAAELIGGEEAASVTGITIGHYKIIERIGTGGMGEVYLASDIRAGRQAALKLLPSRFTRDEERASRFQQEARAVIALNHPNILTIYEIGEANEIYYIASELIEGETLRQRLSSGHLEMDEALDVAIQVASALTAAHRAGIVHRDIKPENIMLRPDGYVKVLDFGIAKLAEQQGASSSGAELSSPHSKTEPGMVMGTAYYMSPEQARGLPVDQRADVWSLGVVLYEMVTGHQPFGGETPTDVIAAVLEREAPPLGSYITVVLSQLEDCITKALAKDRERRYQDARGFLEDLRRLRIQLDVDAALGGQAQKGRVATEDELTSSDGTPRLKAVATRLSEPVSTGGLLPQSRAARYSLLMIAVLLIAVSVTFLIVSTGSDPKASPVIETAAVTPKTLAVLPFKPLVTKSRDEALELGMADSLITKLSNLKGINVRPTSAVRRYTDLEQDAIAAGRELKVESVLEGVIQRAGDRVRVTARLVRVADGAPLWAETFDEKFTDIFAVQDRVSGKVTEALALKLTGEEQRQLSKRYTENTEAYQLYVKGRYYWNKRTEESLTKAIDYFNQAIAIDPSYALAYVGLADSDNLLRAFGFLRPRDAMPRAKAAAIKALELDGTLAEAHTALAYIKLNYDWDWLGTEREFRRALELNPNYPTGHHWYAWYLAAMKRHGESIAEMKRARELDPLSLVINTDVGWMLYYARQYAQAIAELRKTLEMDPSFVRALLRLGLSYLQRSMNEEAIETLQKAADLSGGSTEIVAFLGYAYAVSGKKGDAQKILSDLRERSRRRYVSPYYIAAVYTGLGEKDKAFEWLERAYDERSGWLALLEVEPMFDSLRSHSRFAELMREVGLTP